MQTEENKPRRRASASSSVTPRPLPDSVDNAANTTTHKSNIALINNSRQRWWSQVSIVAVVISLSLFATYPVLARWWRPSSPVADGLAGLTVGGYKEHVLGIPLHPEEHQSRDPRVITLHWIITSGYRAPDGVRKRVYLINGGQFPGPTIEARSGDTLVVYTENALKSPSNDEGVSIHWHGLQMRNANNMDGAVGFTQCAIPPGQNFTYEFRIGDDEHGTFWWHAHSQSQRGDGLYGGLIVHRPERYGRGLRDQERFGFEKEVLLMVGDWYHRSAEEMLAWYTSARALGNEPVPDSLVVNGAGSFNCSMAVPARPIQCNQVLTKRMPRIFGKHLVPTRLRLVNTGSIAGFTIGISRSILTPLQVDGGCEIASSEANFVGILYPGERVDVLIQWDSKVQDTGSYLEIILDPENFNYPNPSLTPNQTFPILLPSSLPLPSEISPLSTSTYPLPFSSAPPLYFDLQTARSSPTCHHIRIPNESNHTILLYVKTQKLSINDNRPQGFINRTSWTPQSPPLLSLPHRQWNQHQLVPWIPLHNNDNATVTPSWVDLVINNLDDGSHPFHLHGHSFYVLGTHRSAHGWGSYNPFERELSSPPFNLADPLRKDTVGVPRRGWAVLRFRADNQGLWMLHCHVLVHLGSGMAMGVAVGGDVDGGGDWALLNEETGGLCA